MVEVERFDVSKVPDHGRPCVVELRGRAGKLALHCDRGDGSLWLFATGPAGGDRGHVVFPARRAEQLAAWVEGDGERSVRFADRVAPSTFGVLYLDAREHWPDYRKWPEGAERMLVVAQAAGARRRWEMPLDAAAVDELLTALREWAAAVERMGAAS